MLSFMLNCLRRTEVETCYGIEMVKFFIFFYILLSAQERQTQPILNMSSEAFAHLHYISLGILTGNVQMAISMRHCALQQI